MKIMKIKKYFEYFNENINSPDQIQDTKYGEIIFSTDVNALKMNKNKLFDFIKRKITTILNRYNYKYILENILKTHFKNYSGYTLSGKNLGAYKANDEKIYKERSHILKIIDVDIHDLIKISEQIAKKFNQESVLVIYITENGVKKMFVENPDIKK